KQ
ncbi:BFD-like [2Fe-2S] binding domain protein, partial [Vibrio parahaemolyticus V-223/04]